MKNIIQIINMLENETLKIVDAYYKNGWPKNIRKLLENSELLRHSKLKNEIKMKETWCVWIIDY